MIGIYCIENTVTGSLYIGSSVNIERRWRSHRHSLARGRHHSRYLQRAWHKYGPEAFDFVIICCCAPRELLLFEQHWLDWQRPVYNSCPAAGSPRGVRRPHTPAHRAKLAAANRKRALPVRALLCPDGSLYLEYPSISDAARMVGGGIGNIWTALRNAKLTAYGYRWIYAPQPSRTPQD